MTDLVDSDRIESIVGVKRHPIEHWARAVSAEQTVYILHGQACLDSGIDLRECRYSKALDKGINVAEWTEDYPLRVMVSWGRLVPYETGGGRR